MLLRITRGLGGRRGVIILIITGAVGLLLFWLATRMRHHWLAPKGVIVVNLPEQQILALGEKARGPLPELVFLNGDLARVAVFAAAKRDTGQWYGLPAGTVLQVTGIQLTNGETWITGLVQASTNVNEKATVHATFLNRYLPVILDRTVEVSDLRLIHLAGENETGVAISGWLRNISPESLRYCVVTCVFQDQTERETDTQRSPRMELHPREFVRFQTPSSDQPFASIAVQISYASPENLREYLSTIVINKHRLQ